ncbi:uncharacterized protein DSM5745_03508 [Aspergillus mulundensis]|uniref:Uncharacterized protein n=1 Tax=Aspergillus mulundensis TaxID=1810919 RepID=A0A3D8SKR4_9EURO|nr:Uncharacterized protein DSM5745_03508 [Aspergillus mulundensis]RDW86866.1 Uncharacterized protein DSM5745_03508 [Aspergillus mulundensis]
MQQLNSFFKSKTSNNANTNTETPSGATTGVAAQAQRRKSHDPVLTPEDEAFLRNVTADAPSTDRDAGPAPVGDEDQGPALPPRPSTQDQAPLSPAEEFGKELGEQERRKSAAGLEPTVSGNDNALAASTTGKSSVNSEKEKEDVKGKAKAGSDRSKSPGKKRRPWSMIWKKSEKKTPEPQSPEPASKPADTTESETQRENEDMTEILDKLNLAADNNRVFSISDETQELLRKFKLIFKDLINGVPTAYHDLEMLLTNGNKQLQETYSNLPSFLQKLIEKLPERWTESLAPEMIAVAAERASRSGVNVDNIGKAAAAANKMGIQVPSLKELVGKPAAIVGMLRSIMAFLRARFPAVLGMNVLWSLALFILLFVLWYCHKRGREVRLENERLVTEEEIEKINQETAADSTAPDTGETTQIRSTETLTTTAAQGASPSEVREGIKEAQKAREKKAKTKAVTAGEQTQNEDRPSGVENEPIKPTRSKSILSIFGRSGSQSSAPSERKIEPYPGT